MSTYPTTPGPRSYLSEIQVYIIAGLKDRLKEKVGSRLGSGNFGVRNFSGVRKVAVAIFVWATPIFFERLKLWL